MSEPDTDPSLAPESRVDGDGRPPVPGAVLETRIIAIARGISPRDIVGVAEALANGGVRAFEVTLNSEAAFDSIERIANRFGSDDFLIGAGTVLEPTAAGRALASGARFLVTPHCDPTLIGWAVERGVPIIPGAMTPTEVLTAWNSGAAAIKLFPASVLGPSFVRDLRGPFAQIPLVPTGGVTVETAPAFIREGAVAVGIGSWLTGGSDVRLISDRARTLVRAVSRMSDGGDHRDLEAPAIV